MSTRRWMGVRIAPATSKTIPRTMIAGGSAAQLPQSHIVLGAQLFPNWIPRTTRRIPTTTKSAPYPRKGYVGSIEISSTVEGSTSVRKAFSHLNQSREGVCFEPNREYVGDTIRRGSKCL